MAQGRSFAPQATVQGQSSEGEHHSTTRKQIEEEVLTTKCPRCSQAPPRSNPSHPERRRQPEIGIEAERDASPYSSTAVCWCAQAYHDFQGCTALACSRCSCQFCGWCLHDCGDSAHDCHEHVRACPERPRNADIFYPRPWSIFEQHWLTKKARKVREALRKLSAQERRELQHDMRAQLAGLGDLGLPPDDGDRPAMAAPE